MFGKLLKHQLRSSAPLLLLLSAGLLIISFLCAGAIRLYVNHLSAAMETGGFSLEFFLVFMIVLLFSSITGPAVYYLALNVILLLQFYRNCYSGQGYLTFTLPVKPSRIFLVSATNMYIWNLFAIAVTAAALFVVWVLGVPWENMVDTNLKEIVDGFFSMYRAFNRTNAEGLILKVVEFIYFPVACMTAVVVGCTVAKRFPLPVTVALVFMTVLPRVFYNAVTLALNTVAGVVAKSSGEPILFPLLFAILLAGLTVGGACLSMHLMKRRLNLS